MPAVDQHKQYAPQRLGFGIITASDSRTEADDQSGEMIAALVEASDHQLVARRIVADEVGAIRSAVEAALDNAEIDIVVVSGGTGFSPRDVTLEAVEPLLERILVGFGELFRMLSYEQIGPAAMLSRATAGVAGSKAVFLLPGSPKAAALAMEKLVLPEAAHLLGQVRRI